MSCAATCVRPREVWSYALQHGTGEEAAQGLARRCATLAELQELVSAGGWRAQEALREAGVANPGRLIGSPRGWGESCPGKGLEC